MVRSVEHWMPRHRITVPEYYRMAELGVLAPDARVELIEGEIIDMPPMGSAHASVITRLHRLLTRALGEAALVRAQLPLHLDQLSEPEPDLLVARPRADDYEKAHPDAKATLLVIEVGATSVRYDREVKGPLYARHGIPELWVIDLQARQITTYREPQDGLYTRVNTAESFGPTSIAALPQLPIDLGGLLG